MTCFSSPVDYDAVLGEPEMNDLVEWITPEVILEVILDGIPT